MKPFYLFIFLLTPLLHARDDIQGWLWLDIKFDEYKQHRLALHLESWHAKNVKKEKLKFVSLRYKYEYFRHTQLGINYSYLNSRNLMSGDWSSHQRAEVELSPRANIDGRTSFFLRNRLEYRWFDAVYKDEDIRFRQRPQFTFHTGHEILTKFYFNTEYFYSFEQDKLNEFRTIPLGVGFKLFPKLSMNTFYLINSKRPSSGHDWQQNHILGTHFIYRL